MASAKRKQDEKNLKILRELVSQPGNKECFDCRQRGPTYVNMTIGSFICTSCSGILRGLTPPHRVKSISMATFTQDEIEHIKERGNDHCRRIWLGLADPPTLKILDSKDEQKIKDLMIAKYEAKRYYLDPAVQTQARNQKSPANNVKSNQTIIPRVPLLGTSTVSSPTQRIRNSDPTNANTNTFNAEFVADFSKVQDSFSTTIPALPFNQAFTPQPSFANFDNNPIFNSPKSTDSSFSNDTTGSFAKFNGTNNPPPEDRYAALKDLDSLMKQTQIKEEPAIAPVSAWDPNNSAGTNAVWGSNNQTTNVISNPFTVSDVWQPATNFANNNNNNSQSMDNTCNSANPFRTMQFPTNNEHQWFGVGSPANGKIVTSSQMTTPFSNKAWQPTVTSYHANPFMVGSGVATTTRNTNNPFL